MNISPVSAVLSVSPTVQSTVQPTAKSENASTNRTTPGTAAYPHAPQVDQALRGSLTITTVPTLATAALVGLSSLPVAGAQGVNQQIATLTGITNVLTNITTAIMVREAASLAQIETLTSVTVANAVQTAANSCQLTTLTNITTVNSVQLEMLQNLTTVMLQLRAEDREDNALTRRAGEASATRIELIACFALAVAVLLCIPQVRAAISKAILSIPNAIRAIPNAINSAIGHFSPSTPTPPASLNPAREEEDLERGSNHSAGDGSWANQPFESGVVAINLDASSHSSHASNSGEEKAGDLGSNHSVSSRNSHASDSDEAKA
jgi:hypothetical protein